MKITSLSAQIRNPDRVNVAIDGRYRLSLTVAQIVDLKLRVGTELDEAWLQQLDEASEVGKLYARAVEYCAMRPHSEREVRDYLQRKTRTTRYRSKRTGEIKERVGVSQTTANTVYDMLVAKRHINDEAFADFWVEYRYRTKGASVRKLRAELCAKGVDGALIEAALAKSRRSDADEITKVIAKKRAKYADEQKLMQYLGRQGFSYNDIKDALGRKSC